MKLRLGMRVCGVVAAFAVALLVMSGCETTPKKEVEVKPLRLATLFSDRMVLQRQKMIPVWGWGNPGSEVTVELNGNSARGVVGKDGKWLLYLPSMDAGGAYEMTVTSGDDKLTVKDVLLGDVWICSGQSNMEFGMGSSRNADAEAKAANYPQIRHIKIAKNPASKPQVDVTGKWVVASPETARSFTAVGYFFGRDLHKHLNVPIGLINTSWGGTRVEAWTSRDVLVTLPGTKDDIKKLDEMEGSLPALIKKYDQGMVTFNEEYKKFQALEKDVAHQKKLADPKLNDSSWKSIPVPGNWEANGHPGLDGEVWYRRTVTIPKSWAGKDLALELGPIDEIDTAFFNGVKVGERGSLVPLMTDYWNQPRHYTVPGKLVKPGKAVIAMRIVDQCGQGGPWGGDAKDIYVVPKAMQADAKKRIALAGPWKYNIAFALPRKPRHPSSPNTASVLYNGMVNGLIPYGIKGAIWYQGESNAGNAYEYRVRFPAMINDWRSRWGEDFPFFWVQLANFRKAPSAPQDSSWAVVRESQNLTMALPNTGTGLAIDIGEAKDIHPKNKQDVGHRLSLAARHVAYGEDLVYAGPTYKSMKVEGNKIRISFDHIGGGLVAKGGALKQFAIAGKDQKFVWADAKIDGNTVVVSAKGVAKPVAVRYAWADNPAGCNLYNKAGLPANPFRTDTWKVATESR